MGFPLVLKYNPCCPALCYYPRIPKILLEQSGINTEVEIEVESDRLTVRPAQQRRIGWNKAFAEMAENQDDILLDEINTTDWDQNEWEW
jgi:antitoxin MazE